MKGEKTSQNFFFTHQDFPSLAFSSPFTMVKDDHECPCPRNHFIIARETRFITANSTACKRSFVIRIHSLPTHTATSPDPLPSLSHLSSSMCARPRASACAHGRSRKVSYGAAMVRFNTLTARHLSKSGRSISPSPFLTRLGFMNLPPASSYLGKGR